MESLATLEIGERYPFEYQEGTHIDLFRAGHNLLRIAIHDINETEKQDFKKSKIEVGLIVDQTVIIIIFKFGLSLTLDCFYDARKINRKELTLFDITSGQRLVLDMHIIDAQTEKLEVMRSFTLPPFITSLLCSSIQDQLSTTSLGDAAINKYISQDTDDLVKQTTMYAC